MRALLVSIEASLWSQISAVVFGCMFVILTVWVLMPSRKGEYRRAENLPFQD